MKKSLKIVSVVLMILAMVLVAVPVFANETGTYANKAPGEIIEIDTDGTENIVSVGNSILGIIRIVGSIVAVGMIIVLGIKYMMGSAEERAEYKKTLFPYFIGAILIFAAANLADMIYTWAQEI